MENKYRTHKLTLTTKISEWRGTEIEGEGVEKKKNPTEQIAVASTNIKIQEQRSIRTLSKSKAFCVCLLLNCQATSIASLLVL